MSRSGGRGSDAAQLLSDMRSRFNFAENWRKQYDGIATEDYQLYIGYRSPLDEEHEGRSNLHIPRVAEQVDTLRSRYMEAFFGSARPYIDFIPMPGHTSTPETMAQNTQKAGIGAATVDMQFERNSITTVAWDWFTSVLIFPAGIWSVGWRYEDTQKTRTIIDPMPIEVPTGMVDPMTGEPLMSTTMSAQDKEIVEKVVIWDDNEVSNVDFYDIWFDPRGNDVDNCRYCFSREWMTRQQVEGYRKRMQSSTDGKIFPVNLREIAGTTGGSEEGRWARQSAVGMTPEETDSVWPTDGAAKGKELFEILHMWEDGRHTIMINRQAVLFDGPNLYNHGLKPFSMASYDRLPGELYGRSAVRLMNPLAHELNTVRNQRIDSVSFVNNQGWYRDRNSDITDDELRSSNHQIIDVDGLQGGQPTGIAPIIRPQAQSSLYTEEQVIKSDMEGVIGAPSMVRGAASATAKTATETMSMVNSAGTRFSVRIKLFEAALKRVVLMMDKNNQQFIEQARLVRLYGIEGPEQWRMASPDMLQGEWDYRPAGSNTDPAANKEVRRQQLMEILQLVLKGQNPYIDAFQLTKNIMETYDIRNPEKLLLSPEEVAKQKVKEAYLGMAVQQQVTMMQQQMAPPPAPQQQGQMQGPEQQGMPPGAQGQGQGPPQQMMPPQGGAPQQMQGGPPVMMQPPQGMDPQQAAMMQQAMAQAQAQGQGGPPMGPQGQGPMPQQQGQEPMPQDLQAFMDSLPPEVLQRLIAEAENMSGGGGPNG